MTTYTITWTEKATSNWATEIVNTCELLDRLCDDTIYLSSIYLNGQGENLANKLRISL